MKTAKVLLLLGASGSGKSSLIQAGLIPALDDQLGANNLVILSFVPDVNPFESFYGCLLANRYPQAEAKLAQRVEDETLNKVVNGLKKEAQWLIFIDQFEELFTRTPKTEQSIFIKSLIHLIEKSDDSVKLVMTMRADFLDKLSPYPDLGEIYNRYNLLLTDMDDSELRLAIAEPAARNGVIFEQGLIDTIIADFKQQAGSLPLLQYILDLLWKNDKIQDRVLNLETYKKLGGVTGALQKQANIIYEKFDESQRKLVKQIFLELISLEGKEPVSRRADKFILEKNESQKEVLDQLVDNRLLVSRGEDGKATVEVAHEALLRSWPVLKELIQENEQMIVLRNRLYADAKQWDELRKQDAVKARGELWSGSKLARIVELRKEQSLSNLDAIAHEFIDASVEERDRLQNAEIERQKRDKKTAQRIAAGSLVAVILSSSLAWMAWQKTRQAEYNQAESLGRYSLSLFNDYKELEAFVAAIKAGKILHNQHKTNREVLNALHTVLVEGSERNRLEGHNSYVSSVSISPDGKTLASGSFDNTIKLWNIQSGAEIRTLIGHDETVSSVSISPDGKTLVSGSRDGTIKLWNIQSGAEIRTLIGHDGIVTSVSISPDGQILASGSSDNTIKLWNIQSGAYIRTLIGHNSYVSSVSISPDGQILASGSEDQTIKLWNIQSGAEIRTLIGHNSYVSSVSISPNGQILASGSGDKTIKLWNIQSGAEIHTLIGHDDSVTSVSISRDGKTLASGSYDNTIKFWNIQSAEEIRTLHGHDGTVMSISISPDGKTLASGSADKMIKFWNIQSGAEIPALIGHDDYVTSVSISRDGKTLASGSYDKTIILWNLESGAYIRTLIGHDDFVMSVSISPDGKTLASGSSDDTIKLWNLESGKEIRTLTGHDDSVHSVSFSPDGKTLASGSEDDIIKLWNLQTGEEIRTLTGHDDSVYSMSFSPDGKTLASESSDNTIKLWNLESGKEIRISTGHDNLVYSLSFSPDGKTLASGSSDNTIKLWNLQTGAKIRTLKGHDDYVYSVSISPDGKTLASGSEDGTIKLWNLQTGEEIRTLTGHDDSVHSVSFSPDGKTLASGSKDNTIKLWDLSLDFLLVHNCNWVRNYLAYNPNVSESDRHLCDGIGGEKPQE